jgi:hypothetical protein
MVTHKCNKEQELGAMMAEIKNLKDTTNRIENKLDLFIDTADRKYATKEELYALKEANKRQDEDISWTKEKIIDLLMKAASVTAIVVFGAKASGLI